MPDYALRVRLVSRKVHVDMTPDVNPVVKATNTRPAS